MWPKVQCYGAFSPHFPLTDFMISPVSSSVADRWDRQVLPSHRLSLSENKIVNPCLLRRTSHMTDPVKKNFFQQVLLQKCSNATCLILPSKTLSFSDEDLLEDKVKHFGSLVRRTLQTSRLCIRWCWPLMHFVFMLNLHDKHHTCMHVSIVTLSTWLVLNGALTHKAATVVCRRFFLI